MAKINLNNVTNPQNTSVMNSNFQKIQDELNLRVLYRNNPTGEPNQMSSNLDMNGRRVYNLPEPVLDHEPARVKDLKDKVVGGDYQRVLRVPNGAVTELGGATERSNKFLSFDAQGNPQTVVENGTFPDITRRLDHAILQYETLAEAESAAATLPDGQRVVVDETKASYIVSMWELVFSAFIPVVVEESFVVTVGVGGDVQTINKAIELATRKRPNFKSSNVQCEVRLLSGFVAREQVIAKGGQDLGWIKITSVDPVVTIDETFITENIMPIDRALPFIGAKDNSTAPHLAALFAYADNQTAQDGIVAVRGSKVSVEPECGVQNCRRGIIIHYGSEGWCYMDGLRAADGSGTTKKGADFRNCLSRALDVQYGSRAGFARSNFDDAAQIGGPAVYAIWASQVDIFQSSVKRSGYDGVVSRDGATINAREINVSDCGGRAFWATHCGRINARSKKAANVAQWVGDSAKRCRGDYAVLASYSSWIEAAELDVSGAANVGVHASNGSNISFTEATANNCGAEGILCVDGATISALRANASNCVGANIKATEGGRITFGFGVANGSAIGAFAQAGAEIIASGASFASCGRAVQVTGGAKIYCLNANLNNASERVVSCIGGEVYCTGSTFAGAVAFQITVREGGKVVALNSAMNVDLRDGGGIVHNSGGTGPVSQTVNTITAQGIIFR